MRDEDVKDLVMTHDKHIEVMSQSIEHLASAVGTTNSKMEEIIGVLSTQNVIMEKVNNMDTNIKEFADRIGSRIEAVEKTQNADGCAPLKVLESTAVIYDKRLGASEKHIGALYDETKRIIPPSVIKWVLGLLILEAISFGTYTVQFLHEIDTAARMQKVKSEEIRKRYDEKIEKLENYINRNYGHIIGLRDKE